MTIRDTAFVPRTDVELSNIKQGKVFWGWLAGVVFTFSVLALYLCGAPLYYALAGALFVLIITPIVLLGLVLMLVFGIVIPYEAAFFTFITLLNSPSFK